MPHLEFPKNHLFISYVLFCCFWFPIHIPQYLQLGRFGMFFWGGGFPNNGTLPITWKGCWLCLVSSRVQGERLDVYRGWQCWLWQISGQPMRDSWGIHFGTCLAGLFNSKKLRNSYLPQESSPFPSVFVVFCGFRALEYILLEMSSMFIISTEVNHHFLETKVATQHSNFLQRKTNVSSMEDPTRFDCHTK